MYMYVSVCLSVREHISETSCPVIVELFLRCLRAGLSQSPFLTSTLPGPSASKVTTLYRYTNTHPFNSPLSGTTQVSRYKKDKTNLDFTEVRDSE